MTAAAAAAPTGSKAPHWLVAAALAVLALIAADAWRADRRSPIVSQAKLDPGQIVPGAGPRTFAEALARAEREVAGTDSNLERHPGEWLRMEDAARALLDRHRLTGNAADLAAANRLLDRAMALAPWPAGPALSQAAASLATHDLDRAEQALDRFDAAAVPWPAAEQAEARSLRCEIAYQRGRLAEARRLCAEGESTSMVLRRANLSAKSGDTAKAGALIEGLLRGPGLSPQTIAALALQRASVALEEGDWQASGRWSRAAEAILPGYWLSEAFVAQQFALEGNRDEARRRYADLALRTRNADVLDALAVLARADGRTEEARDWAGRAGAAWDERSRLLPSAYALHHSEHLLLNGRRQAALQLAAADHRRRPHPAAMVHYAYALWRHGEAERALAVVRDGQASGFRTADLKMVEALALGALGRAAEAGRAVAEAHRLNPKIDHFRQQFVAFAQD